MNGNKLKTEKVMYQRLLASVDINMSDANEEPYERRTISISPSLHKALQDFRGKLIQERNDVDYTTLVNYVIAYGLVFIDKHQKSRTEEDDNIVNALVGDRFRLTELSLGDEYENLSSAAYEK